MCYLSKLKAKIPQVVRPKKWFFLVSKEESLLKSYLQGSNHAFHPIRSAFSQRSRMPQPPVLPTMCKMSGMVHVEGLWVLTGLCSALFASRCRPSLPGVTPTSEKLALRLRTSRKTSGMALSSCCFWKSSQVSLKHFSYVLYPILHVLLCLSSRYASVFFVFVLFFKKSSLWTWLGEIVLLAKQTFPKSGLPGVIFLF